MGNPGWLATPVATNAGKQATGNPGHFIHNEALSNSYVVPMISFADAVQITSFGSIKGVSFNSGMTTGNLRHAITALSHMLTGKEPEKNRTTSFTLGTVCLWFLLGALVGATITKRHPAHCLVVPLVFVAAAAVLSRVPAART